MNKVLPSERLTRLLAFALSILLYVGAGTVVFFLSQKFFTERSVISRTAIHLNFAQMELQAAEEPPPEPEPQADLSSEALAKEEPEPVPADAQVVQEAAAPENPPPEQDALQVWFDEQNQKEKYYPIPAQRAGYEGVFEVRVNIGADGIISGAAVLGGKGHPLLRRSVEKTLGRLIGRSFGQPLPQPVEFSYEFEFKLN